MAKIHFIALSGEDRRDAEARVSSGDGFRVIGKAEFPNCVPARLSDKFDSAVQVVSGSGTEDACLVLNFRRVDGNDLDEHPFGIFVVSGSAAPSGAFLDHGNWPDRTTPIEPAFAQHISSSGIGDYFLANPPAGKLHGTLSELSGSDRNAFEIFVRLVKE